ncbi:MAG TPA: response regulator transcription factor [Candidatus Paceibacterota bacterium]|jgi:DNA-binding response OmpR family regulator|nr:response regulator transcription factor [Candidatus Paceibacterota bacterium]
MRILIIEDNKKLADSISRGLTQEGYAADYLLDGLEGEKRMLISHGDYDLLILDLMLPGKDGIAICATLRTNGIMTPIIMLTAKDTTPDKIVGLDSGADDYLVKPFSFEELLSRVRALGRRVRTTLPPNLKVGDLILNPSTQEVSIGNKKIILTLKEFRILEFFMAHPGEVVTRQRIIDHLWDFNFNPFSRVMDVHINNLRNKLESHTHGSKLETIRGVGYRLKS